ncbi:MAG: SBBP repeat-containing protein [Bacteroidia bacterium]|nr:SBBP repeat-containing protein [Bacteroidia bacterium]
MDSIIRNSIIWKVQAILLFLAILCNSAFTQPSPLQVDLTSSHQSLTQFKGNPIENQMETKGILFLENQGQVLDQHGNPRPDILFLARTGALKVAVAGNGISYQFEKAILKEKGEQKKEDNALPGREIPETPDVSTYRIDMKLQGANPDPMVVKEGPNAYYENYYNIPSAPEGILGVKSWQKITMLEVYPGIDWVIYSHGEGLKYDFIVHPGADPSQIRLKYEGAAEMHLNDQGGLVVKSPLGEITEDAPLSFSGDEPVDSRFRLENGEISFSMGPYDPNQTLRIDPTLAWGTYYGGTLQEIGYCIALDGTGDIYLAGFTGSSNAIASGGHQNTWGGSADAFLAKFNSAGVRQWATYYGGTSSDYGYSTAVDGGGNVYLAGWTAGSAGIASGGHQNTFGGGNDAFLVKFNSSGIRQWGTYYGGNFSENGYSVSVDPVGNVFLAGSTNSSNAIASGGHQNTVGGGQDGFLAKFNPSGVLQWGTYYGGAGLDVTYTSYSDPGGNVYISGTTNSSSGIASGGFQNAIGGGYDAFLVKFNAAGVRQWGTYYGDSGQDWGFYSGRDNSGNLYISGKTTSTSNIASGGFQNTIGGAYDAFLVKFSSAGARQWGTYYGGTGDDLALSVASDIQGNVYLAGQTKSSSGIASGGFQNTFGGLQDGLLVKFNSAGQRDWASYLGDPNGTTNWSVACAGTGSVYITGETYSSTSIALNGHQNTLSGSTDAYLIKIQQCQPSTHTLNPNACDSYSLNGQTYTSSGTYTQTLSNSQGCDSILTINLSLSQSSSHTLNPNACDSYTLNGQTYTSSGTFTQTLTNSQGCDSILTINLSLNQSTSQTLTQNVCDGYNLNGQTYTSSGTYTQTLTNSQGCDSVLTLNLTVRHSSSQTLTQTACDGFSLNGQTYTTSGTYTQMLTNSEGCDSTLTLNLTVNHGTSSTLTQSACDGFSLNGQNYTSSGTFTQTLTNAAGCDSTLTLNLTINSSPVVSISPVSGPVCLNAGVVSLSATPAGGTFSGTGVSGSSFDPTVAGVGTHSITYSYTDANGCDGMDSISVTVVICNGTPDPLLTEIRLFPNPNRGIFTLDGIQPGSQIEVWNVFGQMIFEEQVWQTQQEVNLENAAQGTYFLKLKFGESQVVRKVVIQ